MITIQEISTREHLPEIKARWDNLLVSCSLQAPYFTHAWYRIALETIDHDKNPLLLIFESDGEDIGIAPLVHNTVKVAGLTLHQISFVYNPYTPYLGIIYTKDLKNILKSLLRHLQKKFGNNFYLDLDEMRLTETENDVIGELALEGLLFLRKEDKTGSRYLMLRENFEKTLDTVKKKTQKEFRRKIKRLLRLGNIDLVRIQGDAQIEQHLDHYFAFRARTWKGEEPNPNFYLELCKEFDRLGKLYLYVLRLDKLPVAYLISLLGEDTIYGIKTTYNPAYYAFSPGVILFYKAIEAMFAIPGLREFDIGRGEEQFKREWTSLFHEHVRLYIFPRKLSWKLVNYLRYSVLPHVRKQKTLHKLYTAMRSRVAGEAEPDLAADEEVKVTHKKITMNECKEMESPYSFTVRMAQEEDIDHLAIAMEARNFKNINELLKQKKCVLIIDKDTIVAYFWLSPEQLIGRSREISIDNWGLNAEFADTNMEMPCICTMLEYLSSKGQGTDCVVLTYKD